MIAPPVRVPVCMDCAKKRGLAFGVPCALDMHPVKCAVCDVEQGLGAWCFYVRMQTAVVKL
jgi:hypothetical protein